MGSLRIACIPAYNVENTIGDVVKRCLPHVDKVFVCDDGSTDNTARVADENGAIVINHTRNLGKGSAMRTLFRLAAEQNPTVVVTIDGDGQFLPEEIPKLTSQILNHKADVVIGYRFDSATEMPVHRKFGNKLLNRVTNMASNLSFRDTQSGFRAYSNRALKLIEFTNDGYGADAEILVNLSSKGLRISEEKVTVIYDTGGRTSNRNPFQHGLSVFFRTLQYVSVRRPMTFFGIPGVALIIIGSILGYTFVNAYLHHGGTDYIGSLGAGIVLFALGILLCITSIILFSISTLIRNK